MDFIDYCVATNNYSALEAVKRFSEDSEIRRPHIMKMAGIGLGALALHKLGKRAGRQEADEKLTSYLRGLANRTDGKGVELSEKNIDNIVDQYRDDGEYDWMDED